MTSITLFVNFKRNTHYILGFPSGAGSREPACNAGNLGSTPGFDSWVGKIPWRREWQPTPIFLPGEFHGQKSLEVYGLWDHKESDLTE